MTRNSTELGGRTHGRRVAPLVLQNESAGLLEIEAAAFTKVNLIQGAASGNTINDTLTDIVQGAVALPIQAGLLGGSYYVLKGAGIAGGPEPIALFADTPAGSTDPDNAVWDDVYVQDEEPLGVIMHDLAGSPLDGVGGAESELAANYYDGQGAYLDVFVYETNARQLLVDGNARIQSTVGDHTATPLTYSGGDRLFVDVRSGLLTNVLPESFIEGATDVNALDVSSDVVDFDNAGFQPLQVVNGVLPVVVATVIDVPTAEARALRIKTLI